MGYRKSDSNFGLSVRKSLAERRMTQTDLAAAANTSVSYVNQTLSGRRSVSPEWVDLIASQLKLSAVERVKLHRDAAAPGRDRS